MPETGIYLLHWLFKTKSISSELGDPFLKSWWQMASCVGVRAVTSQGGHWHLGAGLFWWQLAISWLNDLKALPQALLLKGALHWGPPLHPWALVEPVSPRHWGRSQGTVLVTEETRDQICQYPCSRGRKGMWEQEDRELRLSRHH